MVAGSRRARRTSGSGTQPNRFADDPDGREEGQGEAGVRPNPLWYTIHGRAEGIAAGLGSEETGTVHFLLAAIWDKRRWGLAEAPGVTREAIVAALTDLGAALPLAPLPELDRKLNITQYVEFPRAAVSQVLELLAERHPPGPGPKFVFNYKDDDLAWVRAEDGIDLHGIVDEALAQEPDA